MFRPALVAAIAALSTASLASAVIKPFTETFDTNASAWLNGVSGAPTYNATGGIGNSGYISYTSTFTSGATGSFGAPPLTILARANNSANASNDAFVGNWISTGIESLTVSVRHNYTSTLSLYVRLDAGAGAAASLAADPAYAIAPNTWTTITVPIVNSNPPFLSFGAGSFNGVFSNIQNLQLGLYVPASTTFTDLTFDVDNVSIPEPTTAIMAFPALALLARRRRA